MKYATFDENGLPVGFYAENIHGLRMRPIYGDLPDPLEQVPEPIAPVVGEEANPDCLIPTDAVEISDEQWIEFLNNPGRRKWVDGHVEEFVPAIPAPSVGDYQRAIQSLVDQTAASKQFNDGVTLASYKDSTVSEWAAQSAAFIAWRDAVWIYCNAELAKVQVGERAQPSLVDFLSELPAISWPDAA